MLRVKPIFSATDFKGAEPPRSASGETFAMLSHVAFPAKAQSSSIDTWALPAARTQESANLGIDRSEQISSTRQVLHRQFKKQCLAGNVTERSSI
jgi:hypothetical protein